MLLIIVYIQLQILKYIKCITNYNIVPYSYFPIIMFLHILYINLQALKCINCIINRKIYHVYIFPLFSYQLSCVYIQGVTGETDQTSGECSLGQTIPI